MITYWSEWMLNYSHFCFSCLYLFIFYHKHLPSFLCCCCSINPSYPSWVEFTINQCYYLLSISIYSHINKGAFCILACSIVDSNWLSLKLFWSHTSLHHFLKHVSIVTMTQVPAHRGQPNGWNCRTSGRNGERTGPSQIRKWKRDQSHCARGRWGQGVDVAACKKN